MSQKTKQITDKAGLIVTFYGRHSQMQGLTKELIEAFNLMKSSDGFRDVFKSPSEEIFLRPFDPSATHDTTVVQLALNGSGDASVAWESLRQELEEKDLPAILHHFAEEDVLWGYTLIYHAAFVEGVSLDTLNQETIQQLFQPARRLASSPPKRVQPLAHAKVVQEADLWLLHIPNEGSGVKAATVYVALCPLEKEDNLIIKVLHGSGAALLMPDLIAHKAYHETRLYVGSPNEPDDSPRELYKERINDLRESIGPFLGFKQAAKDLGKLKFVYAQLLYATSYLDEPRLSLAQQIENYAWWEKQLGEGDLATYHYSHMKTAHQELALLIDKGQRMSQAADTTINMVQTEQNERREKRENRLTQWVAILTLVVTASQLVNDAVAKEILSFFNGLFAWSLPAENALLQLLVKLVIFLMMTGVVWLYWTYQKWRKRGE